MYENEEVSLNIHGVNKSAQCLGSTNNAVVILWSKTLDHVFVDVFMLSEMFDICFLKMNRHDL
jgi:hypothetical protein